MIDWRAAFDELEKLGNVTPEQAEAAYERLQQLETNKPTLGQALRYGALGAVAGPTASVIGDTIRGQAPFKPVEHEGKPIRLGRSRAALGSMAAGAIMGGVAPLLRYRLDRANEMNTLRQFMKEYESTSPKPKTAAYYKLEGDAVIETDKKGKSLGKGPVKEKDADAVLDYSGSYDPGSFSVSQYSGPMSYGPWILPSLLSSIPDQPLDATVVRKKQAMDAGLMGKLQTVAGAGAKMRLKTAPGQFTGKTFNAMAAKARPLEVVPDPFKTAASLMPTTPASPKTGLTAARKVGQPKLTAPSGPTIADISKPQGFGMPLPGAKKGLI